MPQSEQFEEVTGVNEKAVETGIHTHAVFVYQWPVRIWHWVNALLIVILCISGYFIASPLPSLGGEAYEHYLMGIIRFAHYAAGYAMAIGFLLRIYMAIFGNHHAREMFTLPIFQKAFWKEVLFVIKWYCFLVPYPHRYIGHNPMSRIAMVFFAALSVLMIVTGFALYGEGTQMGSWANSMFSSWVIALAGGNSFTVHTIHHFGMWAIVVFVIAHLYAAVREDIVGRQSIISTMISGYRFFREEKQVSGNNTDDGHHF